MKRCNLVHMLIWEFFNTVTMGTYFVKPRRFDNSLITKVIQNKPYVSRNHDLTKDCNGNGPVLGPVYTLFCHQTTFSGLEAPL